MKSLWNSFLIALSMYSRIPVPQAEWTEKNLCWALCFFPLVGAVIGALGYGVYSLCEFLALPQLLAGKACSPQELDAFYLRRPQAERERLKRLSKNTAN